MGRRRLSSVALVAAAVLGTAACGGETMQASDDEGGTFDDGSGRTEYCALVSLTEPDLTHDVTTTNIGPAQHAITTYADLETVAPEEIKGDLAAMRSALRVMIESTNHPDGADAEALADADTEFAASSERVAEFVHNTCGIDLL